MADIANVNAVFTAQTSQFIASVKNATGAVQNFSDATNQTANNVSRDLTAMNRTATSRLGSLARMFGVVAVGHGNEVAHELSVIDPGGLHGELARLTRAGIG